MSLDNELQVTQNRAAKILLDRPLHSSASDALLTLQWLDLKQRMLSSLHLHLQMH